MQELVITDYMVRAWLKSLCRMDEKYCGYLDAWEEMSNGEKRSSIKSMQEFHVTKIEDFVEWLEEYCS